MMKTTTATTATMMLMMTNAPASTPTSAQLLVVEDDRQLAALLREQLTLAGHKPVVAGTLREARLALLEYRFDLILLDLNLPDGDGLDLAKEVMEEHDTPMLMLTARADVDNRIAGLYAGASDYLTKPFNVMELLARVHVRLRERGVQAQLTYGDLTLDPTTGVCSVGETVVNLPEREFAVLRLLLQYRGRLFTKEDLERAVYGVDSPDSNTIEVYVYNLRRKLKGLGLEDVIRTVRNRGYLVV